MCRFLCYSGPEILLSELLYHPRNSLIVQSYRSQEREEPLNGDGFGVGWYVPSVTTTPCVFTSTTPAWSNRNLRQLSDHTVSSRFFAHVRAASPGMRVSEANCHPFVFGRYLWMHNGIVAGFSQIKRRLREALPDGLYSSIEGTTDSEHAFAVFLQELGDLELEVSADVLAMTLVRTIQRLEGWRSDVGVSAPSSCNFAVTDGVGMAAIRYVSDPVLEPNSLYYSAGRKYVCRDGICEMLDSHRSEQAVILSSECLSRRDDWRRVAPNHVLIVGPDHEVTQELVEF